MKNVFCTKEQIEERKNVCRSCKQFDLNWKKCRKCGCFLSMKWTIVRSKCPEGKWTK